MAEEWPQNTALKAVMAAADAVVKLCEFRNRNCPANPGTGKESRQGHMAHTLPGPGAPRSAEPASCRSDS